MAPRRGIRASGQRTKKQAFAFVAAVGGALLALVAAVSGSLVWTLLSLGVAVGAGMLSRAWSRADPGPMPHWLHWVLRLPRGPHSPRRLIELLSPQRGERMLEVGAGIGIHAIPVASALAPAGILDVLDVQRAMLDDLVRRAARAGVTNVSARRADAKRLPYRDRVFDAAFLISVLGEIPDPAGALRELHRVLKPSGRLLVGEVAVDPDFVPLPVLERSAEETGFELERVTGPRVCYLALLRPRQPSHRVPGTASA